MKNPLPGQTKASARNASIAGDVSSSHRRGGFAGAKRRYTRPRLRLYGGLVDLTKFGGSEIVDSGSLGQTAAINPATGLPTGSDG